jgi:hypothetical protein
LPLLLVFLLLPAAPAPVFFLGLGIAEQKIDDIVVAI